MGKKQKKPRDLRKARRANRCWDNVFFTDHFLERWMERNEQMPYGKIKEEVRSQVKETAYRIRSCYYLVGDKHIIAFKHEGAKTTALTYIGNIEKRPTLINQVATMEKTYDLEVPYESREAV